MEVLKWIGRWLAIFMSRRRTNERRQSNRREFMCQAAGAVATAVVVTSSREVSAQPRPREQCGIGKTGLSCSWLGMGTGTAGWAGSSAQTRRGRQHFVDLLEYAYAQGVNYFDLADMYGSHDFMREALERAVPRDRVMLLTKSVSRKPKALLADIERFRRELDTDTLDIVLLHCLTQPSWPDQDSMKGCMDVLSELKHKGTIRAHGVSCHNFGAMERAASVPWVDVILARINPFGAVMDGTPDEVVRVLETAHENGKGVLGMKVVGDGRLRDKLEEIIRYVATLPCVDAATIGFLSRDELDQALGLVEGARRSRVTV